MPNLLAEVSIAPRIRARGIRLRPAMDLGFATVILAWPAIYNGFPLLYPDTMTYLADGRTVARALFLHQFSEYYGMRSLIYSLVILPLHQNRTAWPIMVLQCFLAAWMLRLLVRCTVPAVAGSMFLVVAAVLSAISALPWCASLVLPDVLGSLVYPAMFLLARAPEKLSRGDKIALCVFALLGIASHITFFVIATAVCLLLLFLPGRSLRGAAAAAGCIAAAAACTLALNAWLYGHPSLSGDRPPFLAARIIADGPGRWYLQGQCASLNWVVCAHLDKLSDDSDQMLWASDGLWESLTDDEQERMLDEETHFVIATVRTYPRAVLQRSASNLWQQLQMFGLKDLEGTQYMAASFAQVMPAERAAYLHSRQARNALPLQGLSQFQAWMFLASAVIAPVLLTAFRGRMPPLLLQLAMVSFFVLLVNAAATGPISVPEARFQSRVAWLIPFVAELCVAAWLLERRRSSIRSGPDA